MQAYLMIVGGKLNGRVYRARLPAIIGRGKGSSLKLPLALVSRKHCEIYAQANTLMVRDLGSTNGTFIDGQPITDAEIRSDQLLAVGSATFQVLREPPGLANTERFRIGEADELSRAARRKRSAHSPKSKKGQASAKDSAKMQRRKGPPPTQIPLPSSEPVGSSLSLSSLIDPDQYLPPPAPRMQSAALPGIQPPSSQLPSEANASPAPIIAPVATQQEIAASVPLGAVRLVGTPQGVPAGSPPMAKLIRRGHVPNSAAPGTAGPKIVNPDSPDKDDPSK